MFLVTEYPEFVQRDSILDTAKLEKAFKFCSDPAFSHNLAGSGIIGLIIWPRLIEPDIRLVPDWHENNQSQIYGRIALLILIYIDMNGGWGGGAPLIRMPILMTHSVIFIEATSSIFG